MSSEQPFKRWSDLAAQQLPGWVGKQIRNRWVNQLDPNSNHLPFSCEDNLLLWEAHKKLGTKWAEISTKLFHSIQPENQIKKCWYSASFKNLYPTNLARPLMSSDWYWWWWPSKQEAKIYLQRCNSYNQRPNPMSLGPTAPTMRQCPLHPNSIKTICIFVKSVKSLKLEDG